MGGSKVLWLPDVAPFEIPGLPLGTRSLMSRHLDHYDVLEIAVNATQEEIARRYRDLVRIHHPDLARDKTRATEALIRINLAYSVLRDSGKRQQYDLARWRSQNEVEEPSVIPCPGPEQPYAWPQEVGVPPAREPPAPDSLAQKSAVCCEHNRPANASQGAGANFNCDPCCLLNRAQAEFDRGMYENARELCRRHLANAPDSWRAMEMLGDAYARLSSVDDALAGYLAALKIAPRKSRIRAKIQLLKAAAQVSAAEESPLAGAEIDEPSAYHAEVDWKTTSILGSLTDLFKSIFRLGAPQPPHDGT